MVDVRNGNALLLPRSDLGVTHMQATRMVKSFDDLERRLSTAPNPGERELVWKEYSEKMSAGIKKAKDLPQPSAEESQTRNYLLQKIADEKIASIGRRILIGMMG